MRNSIKIQVDRSKRRAKAVLEVAGEWSEAFNLKEPKGRLAPVANGIHDFFCEYEFDIEDIPESIIIIPFLTSILPISWLYDADVYVESVDYSFFESLQQVRYSYGWTYPHMKFKGNLLPKNIEFNFQLPDSGPLLLFSGGVDSVFSLLCNAGSFPTIVSIWGADIFFRDKKEWELTKELNNQIASAFCLNLSTITSSFRLFMNTDILDKKFSRESAKASWGNWWFNFQIGIGLLGLTAPLAWKLRSSSVIISSSNTSMDTEVYGGFLPFASNPLIDNSLRFGSSISNHFGYNFNRQDKIRHICKHSAERPLLLRGCSSSTAKNCCKCDKCIRTIYSLIAENADPRRFGYEIDMRIVTHIIETQSKKALIRQPCYTRIASKLKRANSNEPMLKFLIDHFNRTG